MLTHQLCADCSCLCCLITLYSDISVNDTPLYSVTPSYSYCRIIIRGERELSERERERERMKKERERACCTFGKDERTDCIVTRGERISCNSVEDLNEYGKQTKYRNSAVVAP